MLLRQLQHWTELGWRRRGGCGWCGGRSGREFRSQFPHLCGSPTYLSASICHATTLLTVAGRRRRWRRGSSRAVLRRLLAPGDDPRWFVRVPPSRSARRDVQFLVVSGRRRMRAGLVLLPLCPGCRADGGFGCNRTTSGPHAAARFGPEGVAAPNSTRRGGPVPRAAEGFAAKK